jgi:hypothetical protein
MFSGVPEPKPPRQQFLLELADLMGKHGASFEIDSIHDQRFGVYIDIDLHLTGEGFTSLVKDGSSFVMNADAILKAANKCP